MYIMPITPNFTGASSRLKISGKYKRNLNNDLLYNNVSDIVKKYGVPAEFRTKEIYINISDSKTLQADVLKQVKSALNRKNIQYTTKNKG